MGNIYLPQLVTPYFSFVNTSTNLDWYDHDSGKLFSASCKFGILPNYRFQMSAVFVCH